MEDTIPFTNPARCRICGRILNIHERAWGEICQDQRCLSTAAHRTWDSQIKTRRALRRQAQMLVTVNNQGPAAAQQLPVALVRENSRPLTILPRARGAAFLQHLAQLLHQAAEEQVPGPAAEISGEGMALNTTESDACAAACAVCAGDCCTTAGDHAYQDLTSVFDLQRRRPELSATDIITLYHQYLPTETYQDSCVFHGRSGCTLPRDLRARKCNLFLCSDLLELVDTLRAEPDTPLIIAAVRDGRIGRSQLLSSTEEVPMSP